MYRCVRDGTVSLATAPEPGSRCVAKHIDDNVVKLPNLWGAGRRQRHAVRAPAGRQDRLQHAQAARFGEGAGFTVATPPGEPAHMRAWARIGRPQLDRFPRSSVPRQRSNGVDDAWLRAIAHVESGFDAKAVSPKGAQGVMQLMPETARAYGVADPFSSDQSIDAGARHLQR